MDVFVDRIGQRHTGWHRIHHPVRFGVIVRRLPEVPSVVSAAGNQVDLLVVGVPHVSEPDLPGRRVDGKTPRTPQPHGPEFSPHRAGGHRLSVESRRAHVGIGRRHRVSRQPRIQRHRDVGVRLGIAGLLIHIQPQQRGEEVQVDALRVADVIPFKSFVPDGVVKVAVRSEVQIPAVVIRLPVPLLDQDHF